MGSIKNTFLPQITNIIIAIAKNKFTTLNVFHKHGQSYVNKVSNFTKDCKHSFKNIHTECG